MILTLTMAVAVLGSDGPETGEVAFTPAATEAQVPAHFQLRAARFGFKLDPLRGTPGYDVLKLTFPSPIVTDVPQNNTVHAEYFRPKSGGKHPGVVVLHILGSDFPLSRYMAARLADRGVGALFLKLPFYGERRPPGSDKRFLSTDIDRSMLSMRQGVLDIRRALAWMASRPEIDGNRLGVTGISLGGITSALTAGVAPEVKRTAILLAGGGLHDILWDSPESDRYKKLWVAAGRSKEDLRKLTEPYDPLTYAANLKGKRVLMMAGNVDDIVLPASTKALWEAAGKPPIEWFDCGHYSAVGYLLPAIRQVADFLAE